MENPFQAPGVDLMTQDYLAARRELSSRRDLAQAQRERLMKELSDEHRLNCTIEWKSVVAQMLTDQQLGTIRVDDSGKRQIHYEEVWERYLEAEKHALEMRKEGHLAKLLNGPLPDESPEELERLTQEDRRRAQEGLVELKGESGETTHKHIDDLTPQDRSARIRAEGEQVRWIFNRQQRRPPPSHISNR